MSAASGTRPYVFLRQEQRQSHPVHLPPPPHPPASLSQHSHKQALHDHKIKKTFSGGWLKRHSSPYLQCPVFIKKWQSGCPGPVSAQRGHTLRRTSSPENTHKNTRARACLRARLVGFHRGSCCRGVGKEDENRKGAHKSSLQATTPSAATTAACIRRKQASKHAQIP